MQYLCSCFSLYYSPPSFIAKESITSSRVIICFEAKGNASNILKTIDFFEKINEIEKSEIRIVKKVVRNIEEINEFTARLVKQNNRIEGLIIRAHGNSKALKLSSIKKYSDLNHSYINTSNVNLLHSTFSLLENNADITLEACKTGYGEESIAKHISKASKKTVNAAYALLPPLGVSYTLTNSGLSAHFLAPYVIQDKTWKAIFHKIYNHCLFLLGYGRDIKITLSPDKNPV